eukprot:1142196-Pelagomonas_calceolata.AAC.3
MLALKPLKRGLEKRIDQKWAVLGALRERSDGGHFPSGRVHARKECPPSTCLRCKLRPPNLAQSFGGQ